MPAAAMTRPLLSSESATAIRIRHLTHHFGDNRVLHDVNVEIQKGETLVVLGGSGCGKSTFLRLIVGLLRAQPQPTTLSRQTRIAPPPCELMVLEKDVAKISDLELNELRKDFGMLFQSAALFASMTTGENVALPLIEHKKLHPNLVKIMVRLKLDLVGLGWRDDWRDEDQFENKKPDQLSGGQKKRAGLARALIMEPKILFFDEPSAGLDPIVSAGLDQAILGLKKAFPEMTMIVVTHEMKSAFTIADRMLMFDGGRIISIGRPETMKDLILFSSLEQMDRILAVESVDEALTLWNLNPGCEKEGDLYNERLTRIKLLFKSVDDLEKRKQSLREVLFYSTPEERLARFRRVKQFFEARADEQGTDEGDLLRHLTR